MIISAPPPTLQEYLDAANDVYNRTSSPPDIFLTPLLYAERASDGFFGRAYQDGFGNIIIAYEGTSDNLPGSMTADHLLMGGETPPAFGDALQFAQQVQAQFGSHPIYLTGHSLGGAEAEYVATQISIQGGATFG